MSLEARLKQGLPQLALPIDVNTELDLVRVTVVTRQRERRHVLIAAFAGAAAAAMLLLVGPRVADIVLGIELPYPVPPAEDNFENERADNDDIALPERLDQDDIDRHDRFARHRAPQVADSDVAGATSRHRPIRPAARDSEAADRSGVGTATESTKQTSTEPPTLREADAQYTPAHAATARSGTASCNGDSAPCFEFAARRGERYVSVAIADASGGAVLAWVQQDIDGDGTSDGRWKKFCTETDSLVRIEPGAVVRVMLDSGTCPDGSASSPTQGTITVTFMNRPE